MLMSTEEAHKSIFPNDRRKDFECLKNCVLNPSALCTDLILSGSFDSHFSGGGSEKPFIKTSKKCCNLFRDKKI